MIVHQLQHARLNSCEKVLNFFVLLLDLLFLNWIEVRLEARG